MLVDGKIVPGTEGLTLGEIREEVLKGGRFVIYTWVVSVIVMTFRRSSGIRFVRSGRDGTGMALGYSLLSLLLGPWGFPWGLIWTPSCIFTNLAGGKDVTQPMIEAFFGCEESANVVFSRKKHHPGWSMMSVRTIFISAPIILIGFFILSAKAEREAETKVTMSPGYAEFKHADDTVSGSVASGNTPEAKEAATRLAQGMKGFLDEGTKDVTSSRKPSHNCGVWCEIKDDRCIVIMRIPELQTYDPEGRRALANGAWMGSLVCLSGMPSVKPNSTLHVGVRGDRSYECVMTGHLSDDIKTAPSVRHPSAAGRAKLIEWYNAGTEPAP
jgi:hypothetical protein